MRERDLKNSLGDWQLKNVVMRKKDHYTVFTK